MPVEFEWVDLGGGRSRYRRKREPEQSMRSDFPCPRILNDRFSEAVQSIADGKFYERKSDLRRTYRADGNPDGVTYAEVGDDLTAFTDYQRPTADRAADRAAIERAHAEVQSGNAPPVLTTDEFQL